MDFTPDSAKQFLLSKLVEQAQLSRVRLDEAEKRMFLFSEADSHGPNLSDEIEGNCDSTAYEKKIATLLRRSYARSKRTREGRQEWKAALKALGHEDFYGLVMVDQAGIPRSQDGLWRFELEWLPFELIELGVIVVGLLVVFQPTVLGLDLPDWVRWLAYPLFIWLFLYIGRVFNRMQQERAIRQAKSAKR